MSRKLVAGLVFSLVGSAADAQIVPLREACNAQGMTPYPAVNEALGPGTLYDDSRRFPTPAGLICQDVFRGLPSGTKTEVISQAIPGTQTGTTDTSGKFGLSFLKSILGAGNEAKIDASVSNGNKWELTTGTLAARGQTLQGLIHFRASPGACLNDVQKSLGSKQRMTVYLLYQTAQTADLKYKYNHTGGVSANLTLSLADLVSATPGFSVKRISDDELQVKGKPVNVCYAWKEYRLSPSSMVGPGNFVLRPIKPAR